VRVENVPVGGERLDIALRRTAGRISAEVTRRATAGAPARMPLEIVFSPALPLGAVTSAPSERTAGDIHATVRGTLDSTLALGIDYSGGWSIEPPAMRPAIGDRSQAPRILSERMTGGRYVVSLEGLAGRSYRFRLRAPAAAVIVTAAATGTATLGAARDPGEPREVDITFPRAGANGDGYTALTVSFTGGR
jgi:hypothetical protein